MARLLDLGLAVGLLLVAAGCARGYTTSSGVGSQNQSASRVIAVEPGAYTCIVAVSEERAPGHCVVSDSGSSLSLEQTGTTSGIRGTLSAIDGGYHFAGEYFCPEDGCPERFETDFFADDSGAFSGLVALERGGLLRVTISK